MFIVWSGVGWLIPLISCIITAITLSIIGRIFSDPAYMQSHSWPFVIGLWLSAVAVWFAGKWFNEDDGPAENTLFFIRMEYWGPILFVIGIIFPLAR